MLFYRCVQDKEAQNMTQSLHPAAQKGFSSSAELYQQVRPNYPQDISIWLQHNLHLSEYSTVLDLGAGTGKFLPYLLQITPKVYAVEPICEMREQLELAFPTVQSIQAFSHQLPLDRECFDAVICAQSFHWFANLETLTEIHRILKPNAYLVLVWNQRDTHVDWVKALAELLIPMEHDTPRFHRGEWHKVFEQQNLFSFVQETKFSLQHVGTVEQVVSKRLLSTSFIAVLPKIQQATLKTQFEQIVQEYTGKSATDMIDFPYVTHVYVFQKIV